MHMIVEPRIESNIPLAPKRSGGKVNSMAPRIERFKRMKVGDSYAVNITDDRRMNSLVRSTAHNMAIKCGYKVTSRCLIEDGRKVMRIWRVA